MNHKEIIERSIEIANAQGLENVTIGNIAEAFQVKPPSLYKHIRNIDAIHDELGIICISRLITNVQADNFGLSGDKALIQFCNSARLFAMENPGLYQAMQKTHLKRSPEYQQYAEKFFSMISKILTMYNIKKSDLVHIIRNLRALLHGFIDLEIKNGFGLPEKIDESFNMAVRNFIYIIKIKYGYKK